MTGIIDSGMGGLNALRILRKLTTDEDIIFLADRKNAPYGTKTPDELIYLTEKNISRLISLGCQRVLIACCTASTVWDRLSAEARDAAIPIIRPTANTALATTENGKIAVVATAATVSSMAFPSALGKACVAQIEAQRLVGEIEGGAREGRIDKPLSDYLAELLLTVCDSGADTLILGCTHFSSIQGEIAARLAAISERKIHTVDSARESAHAAYRRIGAGSGEGKTVYID